MLNKWQLSFTVLLCSAMVPYAQGAAIDPATTLTAYRTGPTTYALTIDIAPRDDVLGLASFAGEFRGPPHAANIEWQRGTLNGVDLVLGKNIGFTTSLDPPLPQPNRFAFGRTQSLSDPSTHVYGVGLFPVYRETLPEPIKFDATAYLGTLRFPIGKGFTDYLREFEVRLFNADGSIGPWVVPNVRVTTIPEPSASLVGAILMVGGVALRRPRAVKP